MATPSFVWIKLATAEASVFAFLPCGVGEMAGQVVARAVRDFPSWRLDATQVRLFVAARAGEAKPLQAAIAAALACSAPLAEELTLEAQSVAAGSWLVAAPIALPAGSGGGGPADPAAAVAAQAEEFKSTKLELLEALKSAKLEIEAQRSASQWLIPPRTRDMAPSVVFSILKDGAPVGCGFFVTRTLAFTVSHNIRLNGLAAGFSGRTLGGSEFQFDIVEDLVEDDFMILQARARESTSCFTVTAGSHCAALLGTNSMALLGCGIAMSDITRTAGGPPTLGVSLTITSASVSHVGSTNKHFGYTASSYDGDSGACLFFSPDSCVWASTRRA